MKLLLFGVFLVWIEGVKCQAKLISGKMINLKNQPIPGVSVIVRMPDSSRILSFSVSRADGVFVIRDLPPEQEKFNLEFRHIGFESKTIVFDHNMADSTGQFAIVLVEKTTEMKEIIIKREIPALVRSDTVVFDASSFRDAEVRKVEDLLKKMQGFSVDVNGKLSFNGKPVEKVLIDGDDLADKSYQMITRNLDAVTIDKVEVINNFSDNRLMRNVAESNKVGVNLKISSKFQSDISGSAELGLSFEQRYNIDLNTIKMTQRSKWLLFGSYNNVAMDPSGNVRYHYQQEGGQASDGENGSFGSMVLEEGQILMPSIGEQYTRDNSDLGIALLNSWRIGRHIKINSLLGSDNLSAKNSARSLVETEINTREKWLLDNQMKHGSGGTDLVVRASIQRDPGKKHISRLDFTVTGGKQKNTFTNLTSGVIADSLIEQLDSRLKSIRFKWQETFLAGNKVLQLHLSGDLLNADQNMLIRSSRFLTYWSLDSSYVSNVQLMENIKNHYQFSFKVNGKTDRLQFEYGIQSDYGDLSYTSAASISSKAGSPDFLTGINSQIPKDFILKGLFRIGHKTGKKGWLGMSGDGGLQILTTGAVQKEVASFNAAIGYNRSFSVLNSFRINYKLRRGFSEIEKMYPNELMSGNAMILNGLSFQGTEITHGFIGSLNSNNIQKQQHWSCNFSYLMMPERYSNGVMVYPEYSINEYELNKGNRMWNFGLNWQSFIEKIRGKIGGLITLHSSRYKSVVNQVKGESVRSGLLMECWWTSGFHSPLNAEMRANFSYSGGRWNHGELNQNWQYHWSGKLKFKAEKNLYSAIGWNVHQLSPRQVFHGLDVFASVKVAPGLQFNLTGTNLLNSKTLRHRSVMPYSSSETNYFLIGRYLLARVNWIF